MNKNKKDLFLLAIRCAPFPALVLDLIESSLYTNTKFEIEFKNSETNSLEALMINATNYNHPALFPYEFAGQDYFVVTIVVNQSEKSEVLAFLLKNERRLKVTPPVLCEEAFHDLNNPIAIITLIMQKALKKEIMDQTMIDDLLNKLSSSFDRIEKFVEDSLPKA